MSESFGIVDEPTSMARAVKDRCQQAVARDGLKPLENQKSDHLQSHRQPDHPREPVAPRGGDRPR